MVFKYLYWYSLAMLIVLNYYMCFQSQQCIPFFVLCCFCFFTLLFAWFPCFDSERFCLCTLFNTPYDISSFTGLTGLFTLHRTNQGALNSWLLSNCLISNTFIRFVMIYIHWKVGWDNETHFYIRRLQVLDATSSAGLNLISTEVENSLPYFQASVLYS